MGLYVAPIISGQISSSLQNMAVVSASSVFQPRVTIHERVACCHAPRRVVRCAGLNRCMIFTPLGLGFSSYSGRGSNGRRECTRYSGGDGDDKREHQEERSRVEREYSTMCDTLNALLERLDQSMEEREEGHRTQQPEQGSEPYMRAEDSSSPLQERQDEAVHTSELELEKVKEERQSLKKVEAFENLAVAEQTEKFEDSSSTLEEHEVYQVHTPEELFHAENEEETKITLYSEDEDTRNHKRHPGLSDGTVVHLKNEVNGTDLYLVGVVHVSQKSVNEVQDVIRDVHPDYVMVELDRNRYNSMVRRRQSSGDPDPLKAFLQHVEKTLANDNLGMVGKVLDLVISGFYQVLALHGLRPGQELKVAIEEGKKIGAKIVLGDQDKDITMQRLGEQLSITDVLSFGLQPLPADLKQMLRDASFPSPANRNPAQMIEMLDLKIRDRKQTRRLNEEVANRVPTFHKVLVSERNEVMTKVLRNLSGTVVGVVGLGHLDGIEQLWHEANEKYLHETK